MIINNVELPNIDVADAFVMEHYEAALDNVVKKMNDLEIKDKRRSELIRIQCGAVFEFFDDVFGEGTAKKVFGESVNLTICINAFESVIDAVDKLDTKNAQKYKLKYENHQHHQNHGGKGKKKNYNHYKPKLVAPAQK